ncbi:PREDICTED: protein chibby homolog 1-like [Priapulus caudatus]|uniref:Protein chibby homolog 1-like n=1 Tax=Priapulus caudatus TaxID=37621 RepID=A0ABM1ETK1_PRICU|nr:PREDICTED: protein chibby homolog 1-like [Priapulus caudatus]
MPIFGNKFSPKKPSPRKNSSLSNLNLDRATQQLEFGRDYGPIRLTLGDHDYNFDNGDWQAERGRGGASQKQTLKLGRENQSLREENNLLKLKIEILLDMLAETTCEGHLQETEIDELQALINTKTRTKKR